MGEATTLELENRELRAENEVLTHQLRVALRENGFLRSRLEELLRARFGPKVRIDPNQLEIPFADLIEAVAADVEREGAPLPTAREAPDYETAPREQKKRGAHGRKPLPKDIPRFQIEHHPAETTCPCCQREMQRIGQELTEELDWQPASFYSLIGTCKLLGIEPFAYLRDVLDRLPTHPASRVDELTPRAWLAARADR